MTDSPQFKFEDSRCVPKSMICRSERVCKTSFSFLSTKSPNKCCRVILGSEKLPDKKYPVFRVFEVRQPAAAVIAHFTIGKSNYKIDLSSRSMVLHEFKNKKSSKIPITVTVSGVPPYSDFNVQERLLVTEKLGDMRVRRRKREKSGIGKPGSRENWENESMNSENSKKSRMKKLGPKNLLTFTEKNIRIIRSSKLNEASEFDLNKIGWMKFQANQNIDSSPLIFPDLSSVRHHFNLGKYYLRRVWKPRWLKSYACILSLRSRNRKKIENSSLTR